MAWVAKLTRPDGGESVLGVHATYSGAYREAQEFNRRYQIDRAHVEPFDPGAFAPGADAAPPPA